MTLGNQPNESPVVSSVLSRLPLFLPLFLLLFFILWYEREFRFCNGLKTCVNSKYQSKGLIFILHLLAFTLWLVFFIFNILETRDGICENDEREWGMLDFRENGAGMCNQPNPVPRAFPLKKWVGWEKALARKGLDSSLKSIALVLGNLNFVKYFILTFYSNDMTDSTSLRPRNHIS